VVAVVSLGDQLPTPNKDLSDSDTLERAIEWLAMVMAEAKWRDACPGLTGEGRG
jgi:hypothetical protein